MSVNWPDDHVEELKRLVLAGLSFTQIAIALNEKFGTSYSRMAATGKLHRLKLDKAPAPGGVRRVIAKRPAEPKRFVNRRVFHEVKPPTPVDSPPPDAESLNVTFMALEDGMCKWPTGDDAYCGCATGSHRVVYCARHQNARTRRSFVA